PNLDQPEKGQSREQVQVNRKRQDEEYCRHLFYACSVVGIGALVLGSFVPVQALSSGFMFGGTFSLIGGVGHNWRELQPGLKFSVLLIAIVILTIGGYTRLVH